MMIANPLEILLVEDNPGDAELTRKAFEKGKICNDLHHVEDGVLALDFLHQRGDFTNAPRPDIILLDLNLPRLDGKEVLAAIKAEDSLKMIPVIMLSTSAAHADIAETYNLHANSYITKPVDYASFLRVAQTIEAYWLQLVKLPA